MLRATFDNPGDFEKYINAVIGLIESHSNKEFLLMNDDEGINAITPLLNSGELEEMDMYYPEILSSMQARR